MQTSIQEHLPPKEVIQETSTHNTIESDSVSFSDYSMQERLVEKLRADVSKSMV